MVATRFSAMRFAREAFCNSYTISPGKRVMITFMALLVLSSIDSFIFSAHWSVNPRSKLLPMLRPVFFASPAGSRIIIGCDFFSYDGLAVMIVMTKKIKRADFLGVGIGIFVGKGLIDANECAK